jgi:glycerate kinase
MLIPLNPRIILAPSSFKGSLTARDAAHAMAIGVRDVLPAAHVMEFPMADGGEGFVDVVHDFLGVTKRVSEVHGPLPGQRVQATWGLSADGHVAVIEIASAAGLGLVPEEKRNPQLTTTVGVGELIRAALEEGAETIYLGLGGSATIDGGAGMAEALGVRLLDEHGRPILQGAQGLPFLRRVDCSSIDERIAQVSIIAVCDVRNPLTGPDGSAMVFGRQKGARPEDLSALDDGLRRLGERIESDCHISVDRLPGAGAAGGLGAGVAGFLKGRLERGIDVVMAISGFRERIAGADLVLTGEGRLDRQTKFGKVIAGVVECSRHAGIPVAAVVGTIEDPVEEVIRSFGLSDLERLVNSETSFEQAVSEAFPLLRCRTSDLLHRLINTRA